MEKQKILVVDDDKHIAELISLYMMKEGYETQEIYDGKEAAAAVEDFQPDLILLDLMLPGMDGYQVCTEVRKTSRVPIIMLTAKGETFDKVLGLELGADDYIVKPFEPKELVARVKAVLRRYEQKQEEDKNILNCSAFWRSIPIGYSPESNCLTASGVMNMWGTPERWMSM